MPYDIYPAVDETYKFPPEVRSAIAEYEEVVAAFASKDVETSKENSITPGTLNQYFRGDKTMQDLNKAAVGLSNVDNTSDADKPVSTATANAIALATVTSLAPRAYGEDHITVGSTRIEPGVDIRYSAFPSQTLLSDGRILMVWYEATDHITTRDGIVVGSYSSDLGKTWSAKQTFFSMSGIDLRDPTVSTSSDGSVLYLTYIQATAAKPRDGFYLRRSFDNGVTWGPEIRIDPSGSNGAGTAPLLEMSDGRLLAVWFGALTGEAFDSCWRATSTDGGLSWSAATRFRNGVTDSRHYSEPYAAKYGNNVVIMYRHGLADQIGVTRSADNAATWSTPATAFSGTGRPSCVITTNGTLIVVYRDTPAGPAVNQHAVLRSSPDLGLNWTQAKMVERADPQWMLYATPIEIVSGVVLCSTAIENSNTTTTLSLRYLLEGGGISPFGDVAPAVVERASRNGLAVVDSFDRANGPVGRSENGQFWSVPAGPTIKDGALDHTGTTGPHLIVSRVVGSDMDVEAELNWSGSTGIDLVFRYKFSTDFLMVAIESAGAAIRLYKVVGGTTTQLGTATISAPAGAFHKVRVRAIGDNIRVFFEEVAVIAVTDATHVDGEWAGVRLGVAATQCTHRVRDFVARRRNGRA